MNAILLVDDDPIVLLNLRSMIRWEQLGCELVGEASNGEEAIKLIPRYHPHIVITDISMPGVNGIDLIQYLNQNYPEIQVIAISAYDDFDYVRGSLKNGAKDYILKHQMTEEAIRTAVLSAISEREQADLERSVSVRGKQENLMYQIVYGMFSEYDERGISELELQWLKKEIVVVYGGMRCGTDTGNIERMLTLMDESVKYYQDYYILKYKKGAVLLIFSMQDHPLREIRDTAEQLGKNLQRFSSINMGFVISNILQDYRSIPEAISVCEMAWNNSSFQGKEECVFFLDRQPEEAAYMWGHEQEDQFIERILAGEPVDQTFHAIFEEPGNILCSKSGTQFFAVEMIALLMRKSEELGLYAEELSGPYLYGRMAEMETMEEVKGFLIEIYGQFQQISDEMRISRKYNNIVKEAIAYIDIHYKKKISLSEIAGALSVSSSYLCRVFKRDTGQNITAYINEIRMEKARELIRERKMSLSEIAHEIGVENYNYFYQIFKERYGMTPSEYMKKH